MFSRDQSDVPRMEILDDRIVEVLRQKTPVERVAMLGAHLRASHPDWTETQISQEIVRRRRLESS